MHTCSPYSLADVRWVNSYQESPDYPGFYIGRNESGIPICVRIANTAFLGQFLVNGIHLGEPLPLSEKKAKKSKGTLAGTVFVLFTKGKASSCPEKSMRQSSSRSIPLDSALSWNPDVIKAVEYQLNTTLRSFRQVIKVTTVEALLEGLPKRDG